MVHQVLDEWSVGSGFADQLLHANQADFQLPGRDRALATEIVNGVFRHRGRLDWELRSYCRGKFEDIPPPVVDRMRAALYQIRFLDRIPDHSAVNEAVEAVKTLPSLTHFSKLTNGILRTALREPRDVPGSEADVLTRLTVSASLPSWLAECLVTELGEADAEVFAMACLDVPPLFVRINDLKTSLEQAAADLTEREIEAVAMPGIPGCLRIQTRVVPELLDLHQQGHFQIQDASSTLIGLLARPSPGETAVDACCAPGGKLAHLAIQAGDDATVVGLDASAGRLERVRENLQRLGLPQVQVSQFDFLDEPFPLEPRPDLILLDVPCTGSGTLRRRVDLKWRLQAEDIAGAARTQIALLEKAAQRLAPGGRIVYSTCSILREEDEAVVEAFLASHRDFQILDAREKLPRESHGFVTETGLLRTWPQRDGLDGVFAAVLQRP